MYPGILTAHWVHGDSFGGAISVEVYASMKKKRHRPQRSLLDAVRPTEADGPLQSGRAGDLRFIIRATDFL